MLAVERPDSLVDEPATEARDVPAADVRRLLQDGRMEEARLALVTATRDSVYRFLRHMLKDDSAVEDIFQDSYLRAFRALDLFRGDSSLTTWMLSIARNTALNRIRRQRTEKTWQSSVEEPPEIADPAAASNMRALDIRTRSDRRLLAAMDRLSPAQREAVLLFYVEDHPVEEVARITRRTANTIKSDLRRARLMMRQVLEETVDGGIS
ncbi:MAG: ECF subfamily RNA polymerase sigma-24 subunit [bacterium]|nr:MAG: ECF subfamily RNA polymerase sigma-24 subunit [bacterium]